MNKVEASCRPAASLKFTIDNILNLKKTGTSCGSSHPAGEQDEEATATDGVQSYREERRPPERPEPGTKLSQTGERSFFFISQTSVDVRFNI